MLTRSNSVTSYIEGINRYKTFNEKGLQVALAAGGDVRSYAAGPLKMNKRVSAKCLSGGDYFSADDADKPNCKRVLDILRGSVLCKSHAMMEQAWKSALKIFGPAAPAVVKDRRYKAQHDVLLVFKHDNFYVELQLHFVDTVAIKVLSHAMFEIERLNTSGGTVSSSGLRTIMKLPSLFDSAADVVVLLHI